MRNVGIRKRRGCRQEAEVYAGCRIERTGEDEDETETILG